MIGLLECLLLLFNWPAHRDDVPVGQIEPIEKP